MMLFLAPNGWTCLRRVYVRSAQEAVLHCEVIWSRQSSKDALPEAGKTSSGLRMVPVWSSNDTAFPTTTQQRGHEGTPFSK